MRKKIAIPFCPICGKNDMVSILSKDFHLWKCSNCNIYFDYGELDSLQLNAYKNTISPLPVGESAKVNLHDSNISKINSIIIDPVRMPLSAKKQIKKEKLFLENKLGIVKLIGSTEAFNDLLQSDSAKTHLRESISAKKKSGLKDL